MDDSYIKLQAYTDVAEGRYTEVEEKYKRLARYETRQEILKKAIDTYGVERQMIKCCEEFAELTQAITKFMYGECSDTHVVEEMVDALIMIEQLKIILNNPTAFGIWDEMKIERLAKNLEELK